MLCVACSPFAPVGPWVERKDFEMLVPVTVVSLTQSSSSAADQGEIVSRIKSLELENQSLHKGGPVCQIEHFHFF